MSTSADEAGRTPPAAEALASTGLLSFYDRLRRRVAETLENRGGRLGRATADALLLAPDVLILLARLCLDRNVPAQSRRMILGALAYFVLPLDLLPEAVVGVGGFVDDLVIASAVLAATLGGELEPYAERHWSGSEKLRTVLRDLSTAAQALLGERLYRRVQSLLGRRGVAI